MAVTFDTLSTGGPVSANTVSWSHTASGTDRVVLVAVARYATNVVDGTVTYGGNAMTKLAGLPFNNSSSTNSLGLYYLVNPPTGSQTVSIVFPSGTALLLTAVAASFTGVRSVGTAATAFGNTGTTMSMSTTGGDNSVIVQCFSNNGSLAATDYSQSEMASVKQASLQTTFGCGLGSTSATSFSKSMTSNAPWAGIAAALNPMYVAGVNILENVNYTSATVPSGAAGCYVTLIGGGGGGGGGTSAGGSGRGGGGGGGGAKIKQTYIPGELLGLTYSVSTGGGGAAGAAGGSTGTAGGNSTFSSGSVSLSADGGGAGIGGSGTPTGGTGGTTSTSGVTAGGIENGAAGGGGSTASGVAGSNGSSSTEAGAGGAGGGSNITTASAGGVGGSSSTATGGTAGNTSGTAGGPGGTTYLGAGGAGGGGGGGRAGFGSNASAGGSGSAAGGGGGGGGGKQGISGAGGAGGAGAPGFTRIEWLIGDGNFFQVFPF